jgi:hypothetical protein
VEKFLNHLNIALKMNYNYRYNPYRAINTSHLSYTNQSLNAE